jgi:hypothetical protein
MIAAIERAHVECSKPEGAVKQFQYFEKTGRVAPIIEEGDSPPSDAVYVEANRLEAALKAGDPRVQIVRHADSADSVRVFWRG